MQKEPLPRGKALELCLLQQIVVVKVVDAHGMAHLREGLCRLGAGLLAGPLAGEAAAGLTPKGQTSKADAMNPESDAADITCPCRAA